MMGPAVLGYGPVLILASLATGALTGAVLRVSLPQMERVSDFLVGKRP